MKGMGVLVRGVYKEGCPSEPVLCESGPPLSSLFNPAIHERKCTES